MSHIDLTDVVAHIKPEYVVAVESQPEALKATAAGANTTSEPPTKKQKLTGTNKQRPKYQRAPKSAKLCRAVWCVMPGQDPQALCTYPGCGFMHDVVAFLATKPPDLGDHCYNFHTFGRCQYGVVCRFGGEHIEDGRNRVEAEVWAREQAQPQVSNTLAKELQQALRKRQYDFSRGHSCHQRAVKQMEAARKERATLATNGEAKAGDQEAVGTRATYNNSSNETRGTNNNTNASASEAQGTNDSSTNETRGTNDIDASANDMRGPARAENQCVKENDKDCSADKAEENGNSVSHPEIPENKSRCDVDKISPDNAADAKKMEDAGEHGSSGDSVGEGKGRTGEVECAEEVCKDVETTTEQSGGTEKRLGPVPEEDLVKLLSREKKKISWRDKTYLAPLTTLGNLPFRRICKHFGADITCGEMAMSTCLLQGAPSEWALVKRHPSEDIFGIQVCGSSAESMTKVAQLLEDNVDFDFLDINMGCPIDLVYKQGGGSALMRRAGCLEVMVRGMTQALTRPLTLKMRTAIHHNTRVAHTIIRKAKIWDVAMVTLHGRSREQRYLKLADWDYIGECVKAADPMPLFGNGDVLSFEDYNSFRERSGVSGVMVGRGALVKPWLFQEVKDQQHLDISASERLDMLKLYVNYGLEHWGSDTEGVEKTRRFLLEWLSFLHRYIPRGLLERTQRLNQRPPPYQGRSDLETMMASRAASDWVKISEVLLGPTPPDFHFLPKHKASVY